jgi:protein-S-isoprenylcysteine O-methyltransferase Ste14
MKKIMSLLGIGPKLVLITVLYSFLLETGNKYYHIDITLKIVPHNFLVIMGTLLIVAGVLFLIPSFLAISKLRKVDSLYTKGIYSICRHPLYSSWIIFIVPGIVLLRNSLILLTIPLVMYFIFRLLIKDEETFLLNKYGAQYREYKNQVGLLFPRIWKYKNSSQD